MNPFIMASESSNTFTNSATTSTSTTNLHVSKHAVPPAAPTVNNDVPTNTSTTTTNFPKHIAKPTGKAKTQALTAKGNQEHGNQDFHEEDEEDTDPVNFVGEPAMDEDLTTADTHLGFNNNMDPSKISPHQSYNLLPDEFSDQ
jgi:hypothetical protein